MVSCISADYKTILSNFISQQMKYELLSEFVNAIPACEAALVGKKPPERKMAERWPAAIFYNEKGETEEHDSPSELYTKLTGQKVSGQVCNEEGTSCRALSLIDNFQIRGFIVRGNGEPPPPSPGDASRREIEKSHQAWKQHLLDTNKHFIVFHPKSPALQEAQKKAVKEAKPKGKVGPAVFESTAKGK